MMRRAEKRYALRAFEAECGGDSPARKTNLGPSAPRINRGGGGDRKGTYLPSISLTARAMELSMIILMPMVSLYHML